MISLGACGQQSSSVTSGGAPPVSHRRGAGLALGLTEPNPNLIWSATARPRLPAGFGPWRDRLAALRPAYIRVVVDWAKLQPTSSTPPALGATQDGCERGVAPCAPYAGLRDLLAAIASNPGLTPVIVIYGAPTWAALPASGCERPGTDSSSRPLAPAATAAYRRLVGAIVALGRSVGLELPWWSPWNEPNHPTFISPQRARCDPHARATSPVIYTTLARAMDAELVADREPHRLVLGDLAGFVAPSPVVTSVGEFVADLPHDLVCGAGAWAVHYGLAGAHARRAEATVSALERALARTGCAGGAPHVWVTEAGAPTTGGRPACRQLGVALAHWNADPQVDAVFQYTFRQDPLFALGLADTALTRLEPAYGVWRAWAQRAPAAPAPDVRGACG